MIGSSFTDASRTDGYSWVHVTDMDNTMIPGVKTEGYGTNPLASDYPEDFAALNEYSRLIEQHKIAFIPSSGRSALSVFQSVEIFEMPIPPYIIGRVGAEMVKVEQSGDGVYDLVPVQAWADHIQEGWNRQIVLETLQKFVAEKNSLNENNAMQGERSLSEFKISAYLYDMTGEDLADLRGRLEAADIKNPQVIYSSNRDLDILPEKAGKGNALMFMIDEVLKIDRSRALTSGDSGNDFEQLEAVSKYSLGLGIMVGNAHEDLRDRIAAIANSNVIQAADERIMGVVEVMKDKIVNAPQTRPASAPAAEPKTP